MLGINYFKMKRVLLKYFRNEKVYIEIKGAINTRFYISKARLLITRHKLVIADNEFDCIILLDFIKKIVIDEKVTIRLIRT